MMIRCLSLMVLLMAGVALSACGGGGSDDEPGIPLKPETPETPATPETPETPETKNLSDYFAIAVTNAERVGCNLLVTWELKNKGDQGVKGMKVSCSSVADDAGASYKTFGFMQELGQKRSADFTVSLDAGKSLALYAVVEDFDANEKAKKLNMTFSASPSELTIADKTLTLDATISADKRVKANGIQSPDPGLKFQVTKSIHVGGDLLLQYDITNQTGKDLKGVTLGNLTNGVSGSMFRDVNDELQKTLSFDLANGATTNVTVYTKVCVAEDVPTQTASMAISTSDYVFVDDEVQALTVGVSELSPIDFILDADYRKTLEQYMPIYEGKNPPNMEGSYLVSPFVIVYDSYYDDNHGFKPGDVFYNEINIFSNQNDCSRSVDFKNLEYDDDDEGNLKYEDTSTSAYLCGDGDNFTVILESNGTNNDYNIRYKRSIIISGIKTAEGIKNYHFASIWLEKSDDPERKMVPVGTIRVFKDEDGLAENTTKSFDARTRSASAGLSNVDAAASGAR